MADQPAVQFNEDALKAHVADTVRSTIAGMAQEAQTRETQARVDAQTRQAQQSNNQTLFSDPVAQTVLGNPGVQKVIGDVAFTAQNAIDESRFYRNNPEAAGRASEIENIAARSKLDRESAYSFLVGNDTRRAQATERATRAAAGEINAGPGGIGRPDGGHPANRINQDTPLEDMRTALQNATF